MDYFVDHQNGAIYTGDMRTGDRPATPEEVATYRVDLDGRESIFWLTEARAIRETILGRLNGHLLDAMIENDNTAKSAILACRTSLKNMFTDPRIAGSADGATKEAIRVVYREIVAALAQACPAVLVAFKGLDAI